MKQKMSASAKMVEGLNSPIELGGTCRPVLKNSDYFYLNMGEKLCHIENRKN